MLARIKQVALSLRLQLAAAESVTGGRIQARLTATSGASHYFRGGLTAYQLGRKVALLHVDESLVHACNGVSEEVARQMAEGTCRLFDADLGVASTGYAEPDASHQIVTPCAWLAVARRSNRNGPFELTTKWIETEGSRVEAQERFADEAIRLILEVLERSASSA